MFIYAEDNWTYVGAMPREVYVMCCVIASSTTTVINVSAIIPSVHACWRLHLGFKTGTCDKKVVAETEITENTTT